VVVHLRYRSKNNSGRKEGTFSSIDAVWAAGVINSPAAIFCSLRKYSIIEADRG
jgi:hypothetical protein